MLFAQVENVEFQSQISKCKLHNSISVVDDRIRGGQEWSSKNNRYIVSSLISLFMYRLNHSILTHLMEPYSSPAVDQNWS